MIEVPTLSWKQLEEPAGKQERLWPVKGLETGGAATRT